MRHISSVRLLASALLLLALSIGAQAIAAKSQAVVALPNGYYLERDRASQVRMVKRSGSVVLKGPIAGYAVIRHVVAGCVTSEGPAAASYPNDSPLGDLPGARYFVLDTSTGELSADLDKAAWSSRLKALGAPESPAITAPVLPK
jgi:hypothetical protein